MKRQPTIPWVNREQSRLAWMCLAPTLLLSLASFSLFYRGATGFVPSLLLLTTGLLAMAPMTYFFVRLRRMDGAVCAAARAANYLLCSDCGYPLPTGGPEIVQCPECGKRTTLREAEDAWRRFTGDRKPETEAAAASDSGVLQGGVAPRHDSPR